MLCAPNYALSMNGKVLYSLRLKSLRETDTRRFISTLCLIPLCERIVYDIAKICYNLTKSFRKVYDMIHADETGIIIQKTQKIETLDDLFKNYDGDYKCTEWDTGVPEGKEVF